MKILPALFACGEALIGCGAGLITPGDPLINVRDALIGLNSPVFEKKGGEPVRKAVIYAGTPRKKSAGGFLPSNIARRHQIYLLVKARQGKLTQGYIQFNFPVFKIYIFGGFCFVYDE